mmetsp:Transcript_107314/g.272374  ORF Transcript_107314/g.272374 Transcript_107314/m.272374 type:complete len:258 (-) Transcript_107314:208-981(-)
MRMRISATILEALCTEATIAIVAGQGRATAVVVERTLAPGATQGQKFVHDVRPMPLDTGIAVPLHFKAGAAPMHALRFTHLLRALETVREVTELAMRKETAQTTLLTPMLRKWLGWLEDVVAARFRAVECLGLSFANEGVDGDALDTCQHLWRAEKNEVTPDEWLPAHATCICQRLRASDREARTVGVGEGSLEASCAKAVPTTLKLTSALIELAHAETAKICGADGDLHNRPAQPTSFRERRPEQLDFLLACPNIQ